MKTLVSKFHVAHIGFTGEWEEKDIYYHGDLSTADIENDWRFCAVEKRRKQAIFLGIEYKEFPEIKITSYE